MTMIRNIVLKYITQPKYCIQLRNVSAKTDLNQEISEIEANEDFEEDTELQQAELERKRNKSGLRDVHRNLLHEKVPYTEARIDYHRSVGYQRKMYAKYGDTSGVNPGICWPTPDHLADILEYEKISHPYTIQDMIAANTSKRLQAEEVQRARQEDIVKKFAKLEQWKKELRDKVAKKEAEAAAVKERKDRLVEEVRRHFGFKMDPRDDRFKEMLEQKERAEKKAMKEAKRKMKEARLIAKLQEKGVEPVEEAPKQ